MNTIAKRVLPITGATGLVAATVWNTTLPESNDKAAWGGYKPKVPVKAMHISRETARTNATPADRSDSSYFGPGRIPN